MISDKPWIASAAHPQTKAITIVNSQGRVIAALVPNADDAAFICEARNWLTPTEAVDSDMRSLITALNNIFGAVQTLRRTEDATIRALGTDDYHEAADAYEDAHATLIIRENEARAVIDRCRQLR